MRSRFNDYLRCGNFFSKLPGGFFYSCSNDLDIAYYFFRGGQRKTTVAKSERLKAKHHKSPDFLSIYSRTCGALRLDLFKRKIERVL